MPKTDLKKQIRTLYSVPQGKTVLLEVPRIDFVMIDGSGDPTTSCGFGKAVEVVCGSILWPQVHGQKGSGSGLLGNAP